MHIYLLVPVSSRLHGLSGSVLVPTAQVRRVGVAGGVVSRAFSAHANKGPDQVLWMWPVSAKF